MNQIASVGVREGAGCARWVIAGPAALGVLWVVLGRLISTFDPMERDRRAAELLRAQRLADDLYPASVAAGWLLRLAPALALAVFLCGAAAVAVLIAYRRWALIEAIRADKLIAFERARQQRFPAGLQTLAYHSSSSGRDTPQLATAPWGEEPGDVTPDADEDAGAPPFVQLLTQKKVGPGQPLLLGYNLEDGQALTGTWSDLYSTATAGLPGTGKTTSQRFYACQTALHGARFVVCDPHASAGDDSLAATLAPLRSTFLVDPAESPAQILEAARYAASIGDARAHGRSADRAPVILWVDELTSLLGRSDVGAELAAALEQIAQEHRKVGVFLAASGQIWTANRIPSALRDSLASVLCHRMKRGQARTLLPTDEAAMVERLGVGQAVLYRTTGATARVVIPNTTAADVARVAVLVAGSGPGPGHSRAETPPAATLPARPRPGPGPDAAQTVVSAASAPGRATLALDAETARLLARFGAGSTVHELAGELAGTTNPSDRKYKLARSRVESLLRALVPGGEA